MINNVKEPLKGIFSKNIHGIQKNMPLVYAILLDT